MFSPLWRTNFLSSLSLGFPRWRENKESLSQSKVERFWDLNTHTSLSIANLISLLLSSKWFKITVFADKTNGAEGTIASATATMTSALPPATKRLCVYVCICGDDTSFIIINFLSLVSLFFSENQQRLSIRTRTKTPISSWLHSIMTTTPKGATRCDAAQFERESR